MCKPKDSKEEKGLRLVFEYIGGGDLQNYIHQMKYSQHGMPIDQVIDFSEQIFQAIDHIHGLGYLHRDIKPDNFLIGGSESTRDNVYIIDFGLAKCYQNSNGDHIPYKDGKNLTGTARYASIATHKGIE